MSAVGTIDSMTTIRKRDPSAADVARGARIRKLREAIVPKPTHAAIAKYTGVTDSAVSQWESGLTEPRGEQITKLAEVLRTSINYILTGSEAVRQSEDGPPGIRVYETAPRTVPVFGTVAGGSEGDFLMNSGDITEHVPRPPGIASLKEVYGLYVVGDSMKGHGTSEGDLIYVSSTRPAQIDGLVVVQLNDAETGQPTSAMLKQYKGRTPTLLKLAQFNPAKEFTVPLSKVRSVHRVLTLRELMGA